MKTFTILTLSLLFLIVLSSCGGSSASPQEVYDAYEAAMQNGDLEGAMSHIASDAMFDVPIGKLYGEDEIREFLQQSIEDVASTESGNFETRDNAVIFDLELDFGAFQVKGKTRVTVEDSKITAYEFSMMTGAFDE
jgi:ketosteroid isomerase-like protein